MLVPTPDPLLIHTRPSHCITQCYCLRAEAEENRRDKLNGTLQRGVFVASRIIPLLLLLASADDERLGT